MSTSVRLPERIELALANYCQFQQVTKTQVITTALSQYLSANDAAAQANSPELPPVKETSAVYDAFNKAGLIGAVGADMPLQPSMSNARVRAFVQQRLRGNERKP